MSTWVGPSPASDNLIMQLARNRRAVSWHSQGNAQRLNGDLLPLLKVLPRMNAAKQSALMLAMMPRQTSLFPGLKPASSRGNAAALQVVQAMLQKVQHQRPCVFAGHSVSHPPVRFEALILDKRSSLYCSKGRRCRQQRWLTCKSLRCRLLETCEIAFSDSARKQLNTSAHKLRRRRFSML